MATKKRQTYDPSECQQLVAAWTVQAKAKAYISTDRKKSGNIDKNPLAQMELQAKLSNEQWKLDESITSAKKSKVLRHNALKKYQVHQIISKRLMSSKEHTFIDQGDTCACSLAAILNLCQLTGMSREDLNSFQSGDGFHIYIEHCSAECLIDDGLRNWEEAFKLFCNVSSTIDILRHVHYMPFKIGRGSRNVDLKQENLSVADMTKVQYAESVLRWMVTKLDEGHILAVALLNHFVCIIGHDKKGRFLFLGSHGPNKDQGGLHELMDRLEPVLVADCLTSCLYAKIP